MFPGKFRIGSKIEVIRKQKLIYKCSIGPVQGKGSNVDNFSAGDDKHRNGEEFHHCLPPSTFHAQGSV